MTTGRIGRGSVAIDEADMFDWLPRLAQTRPDAAVFASLPEAHELGMDDMGEYDQWFRRAAALCLTATTGPVVFTQTDRLRDKRWFSKAGAIMDVADEQPVWHKIALRREPGMTNLHRPTYSHLIAFGERPGTRTPDTFMAGRTLWNNGAPVNSVIVGLGYIHDVAGPDVVVLNPCTGYGTIPMMASEMGMDAAGCEIDGVVASIARRNIRNRTMSMFN